MDKKRSILRVAAVLAVAFGSGHLVQNMQKNQRDQPGSTSASLGGIEQVVAGRDEPTSGIRAGAVSQPSFTLPAPPAVLVQPAPPEPVLPATADRRD